MKYRIFIYIIFFVIYCALAFPIASIQDIFKVGSTELMLFLGFGILNVLFAFYFLKWNKTLNIILSFLISFVALSVVHLVSKFHLEPDWDAYGIYTAIITNALTSILFWEVTFQIKKKLKIQNLGI